MNIVTSLLLFGSFIIVYSVMIEVFTVLFQLTGITGEKSRTQVIVEAVLEFVTAGLEHKAGGQ